MKIVHNLTAKKTNTESFLLVQKVNAEDSLFKFSELDKVNQTSVQNNVKVDYPYEFYELLNLSGKMVDNVDLMCKLNAGTLLTLAQSSSSKVFSIVQGVKAKILNYTILLNALLNNPFLTEEEIKEQIELIKQKIKNKSLTEDEIKNIKNENIVYNALLRILKSFQP